MSEYSYEPWSIGRYYEITSHDDQLLLRGIKIPMNAGYSMDKARENARRIVACVNACAGIKTIDLESLKGTSILQKANDAADALRQQRDELLEALENVLEVYDCYGETASKALDTIHNVKAKEAL